MPLSINKPDENIIADLQAGGRLREQAANQLFKQFQGLIPFALKRHKLSQEEAFDAYSDSILALVRQVGRGDFKGESKLSTYLNGIFFRKCVDQLRKKTTYSLNDDSIPDVVDTAPDPGQQLETLSELKNLKQLMQKLSESCQQILMLRYYWGYENMEEIAEKLGLKNANTAGSLRHRCMKQLMRIVHANEKDSYGNT